MASLMLHYEGGGWVIRVANTKKVIGLKLGEQGVDEAASVKRLAQAMESGVDQIVKDADYIFDNAPQVDADFVEELFSGADELYLEEELVFAAAEETTLLECIVEAGEALAALFL